MRGERKWNEVNENQQKTTNTTKKKEKEILLRFARNLFQLFFYFLFSTLSTPFHSTTKKRTGRKEGRKETVLIKSSGESKEEEKDNLKCRSQRCCRNTFVVIGVGLAPKRLA